MATQIIKTVRQLYEFKKKRNQLLFFVFMSFLVLAGIFAVLYVFSGIPIDLLAAIFLPIALGELFFVSVMKNRIEFYQMNIQYLNMLSEDIGPLRITRRIFSPAWLETIEKMGYTLNHTNEDFVLYHRFSHKLNGIGNSGDVLECIVLAKHDKVDFYGHDLDEAIKKIMLSEPKHYRIKKHIVLQFKRYQEFNEQANDEIARIINFKSNRQHMIHVTIGYVAQENKVYFICPQYRFPSKYYYYACRHIKELCGLKVEDEK
jgi:hypothetical protein